MITKSYYHCQSVLATSNLCSYWPAFRRGLVCTCSYVYWGTIKGRGLYITSSVCVALRVFVPTSAIVRHCSVCTIKYAWPTGYTKLASKQKRLKRFHIRGHWTSHSSGLLLLWATFGLWSALCETRVDFQTSAQISKLAFHLSCVSIALTTFRKIRFATLLLISISTYLCHFP